MSRFCEFIQSFSPELAMKLRENWPWLYEQEPVVIIMVSSAKQAKMISPR